MIGKDDLIEYKDKNVVIGIPHLYEENKLFYYLGMITDLEEDSLRLKTKDGLYLISYSDIRAIKISGNSLNGQWIR